MASKSKVESKVKQNKEAVEQSMLELQHSRFIQSRSDTMANKVYTKALSEIFNVLCITALHREDCEKKSSDLPPTESSNELDNQTESSHKDSSQENEENSSPNVEESNQNAEEKRITLLDVGMSQPQMLQPKLLAEAIHQVLQSLLVHQRLLLEKQAKSEITSEETTHSPSVPPPLLINKQQFITEVLHQMANGTLPPIGYILSQPERENKPVRHNNASKLMKSEDIAASKCKSKPDLAAKKTTDVLVKGRYKLRREGKESVADSLMSCKLIIIFCYYY